MELDLLRQRRADSGQSRPEVVPTRDLLRKGALVAAFLPSLLLLIGAGMLLRGHWLASQAEALQPAVQEHASIDADIRFLQSEIQRLTVENKEVSAAMADVRSSSAFLTELQRIIPLQLELDSVVVQDQRVSLVGQGVPSNGFRSLNAFLLELKESSFLQADSVQLATAFLEETDDIQRLSFEVSGRFADNAAVATAPRLNGLGAVGMELRLEAMRELGLLP